MYSHAVEQALALPQVRGAPQQMLASLKGVKKEELDNANPLQKFGGQRSVTRVSKNTRFREDAITGSCCCTCPRRKRMRTTRS
jgi:hypothetical protein